MPGPKLRFGDIEARGCSLSPPRYARDADGCWTVGFKVSCPIRCVNGKLSPTVHRLGVYGPIARGDDPLDHRSPRFGVSMYSRQVMATVRFDGGECCFSPCSVRLDSWWESFHFRRPPGFRLPPILPPRPTWNPPIESYEKHFGDLEDYCRDLGLIREKIPAN